MIGMYHIVRRDCTDAGAPNFDAYRDDYAPWKQYGQGNGGLAKQSQTILDCVLDNAACFPCFSNIS